MSNHKGKVLFFDIDGTLVNFSGGMPESTQEALRQARRNGHHVVLCTGRSKCQIYDWLKKFGVDGMICAAGAYVEYGGQVISHDVIGHNALVKVIDFMEREHIVYGLQCTGHNVSTTSGIETMRKMFSERFHMDAEQVENLFGDTEYDDDPRGRTDVDKMIYYDSPIGIEAVRQALSPEFDVTLSSFEEPDETSGEITQAGITKAYGMQKLLRHLNIRREDTIAFGDGPNDLDMLQFAHCGVAMGNAGEDVKAAADLITEHIDRDGVYLAMKQLGLIS